MSKFKKITTKYLCIVSSVVICLSAVFYPFEEFRANTSSSVLWNGYFDLSFSLVADNIDPFDDNNILTYTDSIFNGVESDVLFNYSAGARHLITTQSDVFAYRIYTTPVSVSNSSRKNVVYGYLSAGYYDDICKGNGEYLGKIVNDSSLGPIWVVTNYVENVPIYVAPIYRMHTWSNPDAYSYGSVNEQFSCRFYVYAYTLDNLLDELYAVLKDIYATDESMLSTLEQIYASVDTLETKLQYLCSVAEMIENNTDEIEGLLEVCNSYLSSIQSELEEQTSWLEKIWNTLVDFFTPSDEEKNAVDNFANNSNQQSSDINSLVGDMDSLEKPNASDSVNDIDAFIPSADNPVVRVLDVVMDFDIVTSGIVCSVLMAFIAYVLFGKR